jgi:hypothetical protein
MDKQLGAEYPEIKRAQFLKDNCDEMENIGYVRYFTPEEMEEMKDNLADVSIELNDLDIQRKETAKVVAVNSEVFVMNQEMNLNYQLMVSLLRWCLNMFANGLQLYAVRHSTQFQFTSNLSAVLRMRCG